MIEDKPRKTREQVEADAVAFIARELEKIRTREEANATRDAKRAP